MKIGILTYHRSHNYGALLQALALRYILIQKGHDVFFIDYFPEYHQRLYKVFDWDLFRTMSWKRKIKTILLLITTIIPTMVRRNQFLSFIKAEIEPYCRSINECYDCVVYGSDQIWRKQPYISRYNPIYFGANSIATQAHVAYAASLDLLPIAEEDSKDFCDLVRHLNKVSVRESTIKDFLINHGFSNVTICLDPTLLLTKSQWEQLVPQRRIIKNKYILLYDLQNDGGFKTFDNGDVKQFAKRNGCKIVRLHAKVSNINCMLNRYADMPSDFINLIRNAECVLTSGYHGLIFALIMERPVYCCFPVDYLRAQTLLYELQLSEKMLAADNPRLPQYIEQVDYVTVNKRFTKLRETSLNFLTGI
jgi:hypothetical protein